MFKRVMVTVAIAIGGMIYAIDQPQGEVPLDKQRLILTMDRSHG